MEKEIKKKFDNPHEQALYERVVKTNRLVNRLASQEKLRSTSTPEGKRKGKAVR